MTTATFGKRAGNAIVPYSQTTKRTKEYSIVATSAQAGWSQTHGSAIAYADSDDNWRLAFNVQGSFTSAAVTVTSVTLTDVTFDNAQSCSAWFTGGTSGVGVVAVANGSASTVTVYCSSMTVTGLGISGDVALSAEPDWAAANMEASTQASIYIPNADDTNPGLLNYYEEWSDTTTLPTGAGTTPTSPSIKATRVGNLVTLTVKITTGTGTPGDDISWSALLPSSLRPSSEVMAANKFNTAGDWSIWTGVESSGTVDLYRRKFDSSGIVSDAFDTEATYVGTISYVAD